MTALVLALAASVTWGVGDFLGGIAARRVAVATVLAASLAAGFVLVALVVVVGGDGPPPAGDLLQAAAAGVAGAVGLAGLYRGMAVGAMGVVAPVSAVAALVPFVVGLGQGERPSTLQLAGVAAALAGVALVSREPGTKHSGSGRAAGVGLALVGAGGFGLYFVLMDAAAAESATWAVLFARGAAAILAAGAAVALRAPLVPPRSLLPMIAFVGLFDVAANVLFGLATSRGLVSVVSVLASLYPVITVALAWVVLGERISRVQRVGAAAALSGAALITAG